MDGSAQKINELMVYITVCGNYYVSVFVLCYANLVISSWWFLIYCLITYKLWSRIGLWSLREILGNLGKFRIRVFTHTQVLTKKTKLRRCRGERCGCAEWCRREETWSQTRGREEASGAGTEVAKRRTRRTAPVAERGVVAATEAMQAETNGEKEEGYGALWMQN